MNYCKKCHVEVRRGDACPQCGARLTKAGECLTAYQPLRPVRDWFCWNRALRVTLPMLLLVFLLFVLIEAATRGEWGVRALLAGGFLEVMSGLLALALGLICFVLLLQGEEVVKTVLDKDGVRQWVYLPDSGKLRRLAHFVSAEALAALENETEAMRGYTLVQKRAVRWADIKRVGEWPEAGVLLLYRPRFWLFLPIRLSGEDYDEARAYIAKKCHTGTARKRKKNQ